MYFGYIPHSSTVSMDDGQSCQICFEAATGDVALLSQLCGLECKANVCRQCLTSYVRVSLERFYAGILPRVRCPICLEPMTKSQWQARLMKQDSHQLVDRYETLCRQACGLTAPCCHKDDYSHLPKALCSQQQDEAEEFGKALLAIAPNMEQSVVAYLWTLSLEFQAHKQTPRFVIEFILIQFATPTELAAKVTDELLRRIQDDERRATLLLSFLALRPLALTRCCGHKFCFNCKRGSHHSACDGGGTVNLATSMIQCRSCRATLVKVDGCAAVTCLCGFVMNWDDELKYTQMRRKKLVSSEILFDPKTFGAWLEWKSRVWALQGELTDPMFRYRSRQFALCLVRYSYVLRPCIRRYVQRWRFRNYIVKQIPSAWHRMQLKSFLKSLQQTKAPSIMSSDIPFSIGIDPNANRSKGSLANRRYRALNARKRAHERRKRVKATVPAAMPVSAFVGSNTAVNNMFDDPMDIPMEDVSI